MRFIDGVIPSTGEGCFVVPSGMMLISASVNARVLRWSLMADEADCARVRSCLKSFIESFSEFRNTDTGYPQFAQYLGITL